jgi:copper chaperone CopZ
MKKVKLIMAVVFAALMFTGVKAQTPKSVEIEIKVSSQCSMCKETIEKTLAFEKGVTKSIVDLDKDVVVVTYKTAKTSPEKIRTAISKAGYDADDIPADAKAYANLPDCCKKPADRENDHSGHDH